MAKILLVEDDTNLSEIYQARLEAEGYIVVAATDGETALALAAKEKPDLILSDVMMPKISGFEMLDILRNTDGLKHTKVIMLTALGQAEDKARAEQLGADRYLVKSQVTLEDIVTAAQQLLNPDEMVVTPPAATPIDNTALPASTPVTPTPVQPAPTGPLDLTPATAAIPITSVTTTTAVPEPISVQPMPVATPVPATAATPTIATFEVAPAPITAPSLGAAELTEMTAVAEPAPPVAPISAVAPAQLAVPVATTLPAVNPVPTTVVETPAPEPAPSLDPGTTPPILAASTPTIKPAQSAFQTSPNPGAIDESVVANAIDKLLAKTPATAGGNSAISPDSPTERVHKKIISPIERPSEPSLQDLLAKEEAKGALSSNIPNGPAVSATIATPAASPALDPDAALLAQAQQQRAGQKPSETAFDPNSVAL